MDESSLAKRLGRVIRHLRLKAGMSQEAFAQRCELHRTYVGSIERGEKTITIETASKIAQALGMSLSGMFLLLEKTEAGQSTEDGDH